MESKNQFFYKGGFVTNFLLFYLIFLSFYLSALPRVFSQEVPGRDPEQIYASPDKTSGELRDPFNPQVVILEEQLDVKEKPGMAKSKLQELFSLSIQGIIWKSEVPLVIINNQVLRKGQALLVSQPGGAVKEIEIVDIHKDWIDISYMGVVERLPYVRLRKQTGKEEVKNE